MIPTIERITEDSYLVHHGDGQTTPFYRGPYCPDPKLEAERWAEMCRYMDECVDQGMIPNLQVA